MRFFIFEGESWEKRRRDYYYNYLLFLLWKDLDKGNGLIGVDYVCLLFWSSIIHIFIINNKENVHVYFRPKYTASWYDTQKEP